MVVLARIIPDEEQAISSAAGIKLLSDLLADSRSDQILALTADCIARLAHTRAGQCPGSSVQQEYLLKLKGGCQFLCPELSEQQFVKGNLLSKTWESETPKRIAINSNTFSFETGCFVYHLNELRAEFFQLRILSELGRVTKRKLPGSNPSRCLL